MMGWTNRHGRFFLRQVSRRARLYTEMVTADALIHGPRQRLLTFHASEHPVALQIAGSDPDKLAIAAELGAVAGFDEINLNVGCPSSRVQSGGFGACLMATPGVVAAGVAAMLRAGVPVSVKHRLGIDDQDPWDSVRRFIDVVGGAGCRHFVVHARNAVLGGLSPKDNRAVPPLDHGMVYRLKAAYPGVAIVTNGGILSVADAVSHLDHVDGVMVGRAATHDPFLLAHVDRAVFGDGRAKPSRRDVVRRMIPYVEAELAAGTPLAELCRHLLGLFNGQRGARLWRRMLTVDVRRDGAGADLLETALERVAQVENRREAA